MLADQIGKDYIQAMKDKDSFKSATLSFLRAQIKNVMIDKRVDALEDAETIVIIKKQVKQRQDSIEQFQKGGRTELAEKETKESEILKSYLPEEMSEDQVKVVVDEVIKETGANSMKDMGSVMKAVLEKVAGQADGKVVSTLVKDVLSQM